MERYILANGQAIYINSDNIWHEPSPQQTDYDFDSDTLWQDVQRYLKHLGISAIIMLIILFIQLVRLRFVTFGDAFDWFRNGQHRQWLRPIRPAAEENQPEAAANVADAAAAPSPPESDIVNRLNRGPEQLGDGTPEAVLWKKERLRRQRNEIPARFVEY